MAFEKVQGYIDDESKKGPDEEGGEDREHPAEDPQTLFGMGKPPIEQDGKGDDEQNSLHCVFIEIHTIVHCFLLSTER